MEQIDPVNKAHATAREYAGILHATEERFDMSVARENAERQARRHYTWAYNQHNAKCSRIRAQLTVAEASLNALLEEGRDWIVIPGEPYND